MRRLRGARVLAATICASLATLAFAGPAAAHIVTLKSYKGTYPAGSFFGNGSVGATAPFPNFSMKQMDIFQETKKVYVGNEGASAVYQFDENGNPLAFSALAGKTALNPLELNLWGDVMVDNSSTSTKGRIYVFRESGSVHAFEPSGTQLGGNFPLPFNGSCAGDVDPSGNLWLGSWTQGKAVEFNSSGTATGTEFTTGFPVCGLAIDSNGYIYIVRESQGEVRKYSSTGVLQYVLENAEEGEPRDIAIDRANDHVFVDHGSFINEYDSSGGFIGKFGLPEPGAPHEYAGLSGSEGVAVLDSTGEVYATNNNSPSRVDRFVQLPPSTIPDVTTEAPEVTPTTALLKGKVSQDLANSGSKIVYCKFEWGPGTGTEYPNKVDCEPSTEFEGENVSVHKEITGLTKGSQYHVRLVAKNENGIQSNGGPIIFKASGPPSISEDIVSDVNTDSVKISAKIDPNGGDTHYHFEFGETTAYGTSLPEPEGEVTSGPPQAVSQVLPGLTPGTTYHFRVVASNFGGVTQGVDHTFTTFPLNPSGPDPCENAQVRQQTGASLLLDCRAYELASAGNTGGYDVQSDLIPGQEVLPPEPEATDRVLYSAHFGTIPGTGEPTNFGLDPYVATRGASGWTTNYVGINTGEPPANPEPFGSPLSDSSSDLKTFAFGGEPQPGVHICDPCFANGSSGIPVRMPDGSLIQGMQGSISAPSAKSADRVAQPLSADGTHLVFTSTSPLTGDGKSGSIYDRTLPNGPTHVVSKSATTSGVTMEEEGEPIAELGISADGSRILFGHRVGSPDSAGNSHWHLYMNVGDSEKSIDLTQGASALFDGMTSDGTKVFFTTTAKLVGGDTDTNADLYRADVTSTSSTPVLVSTGGSGSGCEPVPGKQGPGTHWNTVSPPAEENCDVVGLAGGAGVASGNGTVFFLSPEELDGSGTEHEANLFVATPGGSPEFVATLDPSSQTVADAVLNNEVHSFSDFQVIPNGNDAVFPSNLELTGFSSLGHSEIFRYDVPDESLDCVSCAVTGAAATGDASLASGLNVANNGAVFFTSSEPLVLRDTNHKKDVYEWENGKQQLISTGTSDFDSGLVTASADGRNVYFFTRATLVPQDENGNLMKIYDAREGGGFLANPASPLCAASDECHGAGTQAAPPPQIGTFKGEGGNAPSGKKPCKKGFVRKHGKCVKKKKHHRKHHKRHTTRGHG